MMVASFCISIRKYQGAMKKIKLSDTCLWKSSPGLGNPSDPSSWTQPRTSPGTCPCLWWSPFSRCRRVLLEPHPCSSPKPEPAWCSICNTGRNRPRVAQKSLSDTELERPAWNRQPNRVGWERARGSWKHETGLPAVILPGSGLDQHGRRKSPNIRFQSMLQTLAECLPCPAYWTACGGIVEIEKGHILPGDRTRPWRSQTQPRN